MKDNNNIPKIDCEICINNHTKGKPYASNKCIMCKKNMCNRCSKLLMVGMGIPETRYKDKMMTTSGKYFMIFCKRCYEDNVLWRDLITKQVADYIISNLKNTLMLEKIEKGDNKQ